MESNHKEMLHKISKDSEKLVPPSENKYLLCCCLSEKWCFEHTTPAIIKDYDENMNNYCICLDYCTWCLEFKLNKKCCIKDTNCYLCCCTIYFT